MNNNQQIMLIITGVLLFLVLVIPVSAEVTTINQGGVVFIGEEGLDISSAVGDYTQIGWWAWSGGVTTTPPIKTVIISNKNSFKVDPAQFVGYTGTWYTINPTTNFGVSPALIIHDPTLDIKVWDFDTNTDVTGRSVPQGERLSFRVDTNIYSALMPVYRPNANSADGFITIKVKNENGALLDSLFDTDSNSRSLLNQYVSAQPWYWGGAPTTCWGTGLMSGNQYRYPAGTYTISAESTLNNMKNNYKNAGADYTGKTVAQSNTITLVTPSLNIEANKDSIIRSKTFSVTITGKPSTTYYLWVKGTGGMTGNPQDRPPIISQYQVGVTMDPENGPYTIGSYAYSGGGGSTIRNDVPPTVSGAPNNRYYAQIQTSTSGIRTVEFQTSTDTKPATYTIKVETTGFSDIVPVKVEKGAVTISAAGSQTYNRGDIIHLSGIDTETTKVYLFLDNYPPGGKLTSPPNVVTNNNAATFDSVTVNGDNTWSYSWDTSGLNLQGGTYSIYAVSFPYDKNNLGNAAYASTTITMNAPTATGTTTTTTTTATTTTTQATNATTTAPTTTTPIKTPTKTLTTAMTTQPVTLPTGEFTSSQTISPEKTIRKTRAQLTPWEAATPAQDSPLPGSIASAALVIAAVVILWRKG